MRLSGELSETPCCSIMNRWDFKCLYLTELKTWIFDQCFWVNSYSHYLEETVASFKTFDYSNSTAFLLCLLLYSLFLFLVETKSSNLAFSWLILPSSAKAPWSLLRLMPLLQHQYLTFQVALRMFFVAYLLPWDWLQLFLDQWILQSFIESWGRRSYSFLSCQEIHCCLSLLCPWTRTKAFHSSVLAEPVC